MDKRGFDKKNKLSSNFLDEILPFIFDLCNYWGEQPELLASPKQTAFLTNIRKALIYILKLKLGLRTNTISFIINRDHSVILHHLEICEGVLANRHQDPELAIFLKKSLEFYNKNYND